MLANIRHILPVTTIRRERILPVIGKVLVRKGQTVTATDVVAEAKVENEHILLDISRGLGIDTDSADRQLTVRVGQEVARGDVLAGPLGLARRVVRAPSDGVVLLAGEGQVLIETPHAPFQIKAGLSGEVLELLPDRGAIIQNYGALIQGVWGNGQVDGGVLYALAKTADHVLTVDQIEVSLRGSILLAGHCKDVNVLHHAADLPLRGLILGSMTPELMPHAQKLPLPVMLLEGFGNWPINSVAFKLLSTNERREASLNAEPWNSYKATRPELVIPLPVEHESSLPKDGGRFAAGQRVRVVSASLFGQVGNLVSISGSKTLPNGVVATSGEIKLDNGESVTLPLANLEVLE